METVCLPVVTYTYRVPQNVVTSFKSYNGQTETHNRTQTSSQNMRQERRSLGLPSGLFPWCFPTKILEAFLISTMRATRPAHIRLHLIIQILFGEAFKLWSFSSCSVL